MCVTSGLTSENALRSPDDRGSVHPNPFGVTLSTARPRTSDMSTPTHDEIAPVTDRVHTNSWSANLEGPEHAADCEAMLREARRAVTHTASGNHVNLVTHGEHGHPEDYLFDALENAFGDAVEPEYVDRCGCGGHVTRVRVMGDLGSER